MAHAPEQSRDLNPDPRDPAGLVDALRRQWTDARRPSVWAVLAALERVTVELRHERGWTFHPGDMSGPPELADAAVRVTADFLGLWGPNTPLPEFAVELAERAPRLVELFDAVHHRLLVLLARALRRARYPLAGADDPSAERLIDLASRGVGAASTELTTWRSDHVLRDRYSESPSEPAPAELLDARPAPRDLSGRDWLALLPWAPGRIRSAAGVAAALARLLARRLAGATLTVEECVPTTSLLPEFARTRLGAPSSALAARFVLGDRAPDHDGWFRLRVATLRAPHAAAFFRGGAGLRRLFAAASALVGPLLRFDVDVVLAPGAAPRLRLSHQRPARLGVDAWLLHLHNEPLTVRHDDPG